MVAILLTMDQELPVCIADWNEDYAHPSESAAQVVKAATGPYYPDEVPAGSLVSYIEEAPTW